MKFSNACALLVTAAASSNVWLVNGQQDSNPTECLDSIVAGQDYFPEKVSPSHSQFWDVTYHDTYKIVTNSAAGETYLLYQCGTEPPLSEMAKDHTATVSIPIQQAGLVSTTMIPFIELLGARTSIVSYGFANFVSSPCLSQLLDQGDVVDVSDSRNATLMASIFGEDNVNVPSFIGHFGSVASDTSFRISVTEEQENLAVFEWLKFYSLFYNLEGRANEVFDGVEGRYQCATQNADILACDDDESTADHHKPVVLWGYYSGYCGGWGVANCPNYYCEFAESCSATILHTTEGSIQNANCGDTNFMTTEEFVAFGKDADYWFYTSSDFQSVYGQFGEDLDQFVSVQNQEVYDTEGSGPGAWFEQRLAEPDVVLQDFCTIVGRENTESLVPHIRGWFRNVFTEQVGSLGQCENVEAPLETKGTQCFPVSADYCGTDEEPDQGNDDDDEESAGATRTTGLAMSVLIVYAIRSFWF